MISPPHRVVILELNNPGTGGRRLGRNRVPPRGVADQGGIREQVPPRGNQREGAQGRDVGAGHERVPRGQGGHGGSLGGRLSWI